MNELVFQNAVSIPNKSVTVPVERIFGQNKAVFGRSEFRLNQMEPKQILRLLSDKFSNLSLSRTTRSSSFYSGDSENGSENSASKFVIKKKSVNTRFHIPTHKNHYTQLQSEIEKERMLKLQNNEKEQELDKQQPILHQDKKRLQRLKQERMARKMINQENKPVIEKINEAQNEFLKNLYDLNEDLITPQQQKYQNTKKYKLTYKAAFKSTARENMNDLTTKNKYAPGPGDYEVSRIFEGEKKKNKIRSISLQQHRIDEDNKIQSESNKIKNKLSKVLNLQKQQEDEIIKNELSNIHNQNYSSVGQSNNTSYMFAVDDRDRFGDQIFPLSSVIPVPGPGKYEQNYFTMEKKIQTIQSQEEQKKLLKIWLHPGKDEPKNYKEWQMKNQLLDPYGPIHLKHY